MFGSLFSQANDSTAAGERYIAWIDGVGSLLILTGDAITVGRTTNTAAALTGNADSDEADCALMGNLSRKHATINRIDESYVLTAHSSTAIEGRPVYDQAVIPDAGRIELGESVQLSFKVPTPLSASARLSFESGHRPATSIDGVVLMAETCLMGPGPENHVECPGWSGTIVMARTGEGISVKSRQPLLVDGKFARNMTAISHGSIVSGPADSRFRIERIG